VSSVHSIVARAALALSLFAAAPMAGANGIGDVTGLPIPRFVSVKAKPANVRVGPGTDYPLKWTFVRRFVPVEITAEFGQWRRVRDWDGKSGWMLGAMLSGRRTALAAPWLTGKTIALRSYAGAKAPLVARVQPKVFVHLDGCNGRWCRVRVRGDDGYIRQTRLWGVYPGERL
jgi:SH3-like domain-containing protein